MKVTSLFSIFLLVSVEANNLKATRREQVILSLSSDNNIIGGTDAAVGEFPYMAKFVNSGTCGSALIHEDLLVTAASCVSGGGPSAVRIGAVDSDNEGTMVSTCGSISHPSFDPTTLENDIAVIILCSTVSASPVAINDEKGYPSASGQELTVVGFGSIDASGTATDTLQKLRVNYVSDSDCLAAYSNFDKNKNLCADKEDAGICFGDAGNPLVDDTGILVGVASFVLGSCASDTYPDFYVDVSDYSGWLEDKICDNAANPPSSCEEEDPVNDIIQTIFDILFFFLDLFLGA